MAFHIEVLSPLFSTVAVECFIVGTTVVKNFIPFIVRISAQRQSTLYLMSIEIGHTLLRQCDFGTRLPSCLSGHGFRIWPPNFLCRHHVTRRDGTIVNYFILKSASQTSS